MWSRPQYTDLTYMGGTEPCDTIQVIFDNHVFSKHTILNIKFGVNRKFHVVKTPVYRFDLYMEGTGPCGAMTIIGSVI